MSGGPIPGAKLPVDPARRKIEKADILFAEANRHRMGWQTLAKIRGCNMEDLRRHCESPAAPAPASKADISQPLPASGQRRGPPPIDPIRALAAIHKGAASLLDVSDVVECAGGHAGRLVTDLKTLGWLVGNPGTRGGWQITETGLRALRAKGLRRG